MVLRYDSWRPDLPYQLKWDVEPLNGRKSSPGFGRQHLTHDDCLIEKLLCQAPRWENLEMRDGDRYVFTWGEIRVRQIKIAFDKSVWLPYKHIKQLTQNSLETNIKRPIFTIGTVDRKRKWSKQTANLHNWPQFRLINSYSWNADFLQHLPCSLDKGKLSWNSCSFDVLFFDFAKLVKKLRMSMFTCWISWRQYSARLCFPGVGLLRSLTHIFFLLQGCNI